MRGHGVGMELIFTLGVVGRVLHMLSSHVITEIKALSPNEGLEKNVQEAKTIFSNICVSFQDKNNNKGLLVEDKVRNVIRSLKRRAYEVEDILDKAATSHLEGKGIHERSIDVNSGMRRIISDLKNICHIIMGKSCIMSRKPCYIPPVFFFSSTTNGTSASSHYDRLLPSLEDEIIDRESEKKQLLDWIFHPTNQQQQHPNLMSVTGDPGIGKTTLAKLIFNDALVSASFDLLLWVSLKSTYYSTTTENLRHMIVEIIRSFTHQSWLYLQGMDMETLQHTLCHILADQKYLLVLDDARYLSLAVWVELRKLLSVGSMGSTVIFTTSSLLHSIDLTVGEANSLGLEGLGETGSWLLFSRCCKFDEEAEQEFPFLGPIEREMVEKCHGSPLAIKTLGSMLRTIGDEHMWKQITESQMSTPGHKKPTTILSICLQSMPLELLQCFAAYAILSKHTALPRHELVYFWMAQGLLYSTEANEDLRDIGHRYCNELLSRSFIQSYHDRLFVNNAFQELGYRYRLEEAGRQLTDIARLDLIRKDNVRTFLFRRWPGPVEKGLLEGLISHLRHACVLLLDGSVFEELPVSIGNLKLLRYLSLQGNHKLQLLAETVCNLVNLQTLDLSGCQHLRRLPKSMHKLANLRHLFLSLKLIHIRGKALKSLRSLHHLKICYSPNLKSISKGIARLTDLRVLQIHDCPFIASLPDNIKFLKSLKELSIINCEKLNLEKWDGLYGLRVLEFLQLEGLPMLINFPEGLLSSADSLQHLILRDCQYLTALPECLHRYKSLLEIVIEDCSNMTSLPMEIKAIEKLQILKIVNCPHLIARFQTIKGEDWHLISHIPKIHLQTIPNRRATSTLKKGAQSVEKSLNKQDEVNQVGCPRASSSFGRERLLQQNALKRKLSEEFDKKVDINGDMPKEGIVSKVGRTEVGLLTENRLNKQEAEVKEVDCSMADTSVQEVSRYSPTEMDEDMVPHASLEEEMKDYCSILNLLQENYEIEKNTLIQLWMAGEYIKDEPVHPNGEEFFNFVLNSEYLLHFGSNFMTGKDRYRINIKKINELIDNQKDNGSSYLKLDDEYQKNSRHADSVQHVSLVCNDIDGTIFQTLQQFSNLRTLLFLGNHGNRVRQIPDQLFLSLENLHVLDLSRTHISDLPSSVGQMVHLRYLDLSWTLIEWLPDTICSLINLQTLKLRGCSNLHELPAQLGTLTKLQHLDLDVLRQLEVMPKGIGALVNLQTLPAFLVGTEDECKIQELRELNNLAGNFCIAKLENVRNADEARETVLYKKEHLERLELRWTASELSGMHHNSDAILECLQPCTSLEELQIFCYEGSTFPSWISNIEFSKLTRIIFYRCENVLELPVIEKLPLLKHLDLVKMNSVEKIERGGELEKYAAFPKLEKLEINEMQSLKFWDWKKRNEGDFVSFTQLIINDCPELQQFDVLPHLSSIKHFEIRECPELQSLSDIKLPDSLEELTVEDCPQIQKKCAESDGEDWYKIEHVLKKRIQQVDEDEMTHLLSVSSNV